MDREGVFRRKDGVGLCFCPWFRRVSGDTVMFCMDMERYWSNRLTNSAFFVHKKGVKVKQMEFCEQSPKEMKMKTIFKEDKYHGKVYFYAASENER